MAVSVTHLKVSAIADNADASAQGQVLPSDWNAQHTVTGLATVATSGSAADLGSGTLPSGRMPALTGDVTSSVGGVATTLATVNGNVGSFTNANITVNAKGLVTAAANGTGSGWVQLAQTVTSSSQASVDWQSISSAYTHLVVVWQSRDTQAGTGSNFLRLKINNDATAGNYSVTTRDGTQNQTGFNNNVAASTAGVVVGYIPQDSSTAGLASTGSFRINNYSGTTWHKNIEATVFDPVAVIVANHASRWGGTSAVNRLTLTTEGTALKDNSVFTLYGLA